MSSPADILDRLNPEQREAAEYGDGPLLVLADEPTANLDSTTARELIELMAGLNSERGITFLFSTHDPQVMEAARRVVRLRDGRVIGDSRTDGA